MSKTLSISTNRTLEVIKESVEGVPVIVLRGKFQQGNAENNNGRKYKTNTLVDKILNARCTPEKLLSDPLFMEIIHPSDDLTGEINPEKVAGKIRRIWMEGDTQMGEAIITPETPCGGVLYILIDKYNARPGVSSRAFGRLAQGDWVDHDTYKFITYDFTFNPSTKGAFLDRIAESVELKKILEGSSERQLQVINETFRVSESRVLSDIILNSKIVNPMEEAGKVTTLTSKISTLSESVGSLRGEISTLKESVTKKEGEIKTLQESEQKLQDEVISLKESATKNQTELTKVQGFYEKSLKVLEELKESFAAKNSAILESRVLSRKAAAVTAGLKESAVVMEGKYNKALKVLSLIQERNVSSQIQSFVESSLGEGSWGTTSDFFAGVTTLKEAKDMVGKIRTLRGDETTPTTSTLQERKDGNKTLPPVIKEGTKGGKTLAERRADMYDLN